MRDMDFRQFDCIELFKEWRDRETIDKHPVVEDSWAGLTEEERQERIRKNLEKKRLN